MSKTRPTSYSNAVTALKRSFGMIGLFSAVVNILMLAGPLFMLQVYDRVLSSGSVPTLQGLLVIVVLAYVLLAIYDLLRTRLLSRAAMRLDQAIGAEAYAIWVRSGLAGSQDASRPMADLATLRGFMSSGAMLGLFDTPWIPLYLGIVFIVHPWLGVLTVGGLVVVTGLAWFNQLATNRHFSRAIALDSQEAFFVEQSRRNAEAILPLGMAPRMSARWARLHRQGLAVGQVGADRAEVFTASSKAFRLLLQSALLGLGAYLSLTGAITPGMIIAATIIAGRALAPVDQVIGQWRAIQRAHETHLRLQKLFADQPVPRPTIDLPAPTGHLTVRGLTKFAPGQQRAGERPAILEGVSFALAPGDVVGVIGPSAGGKSTLARLLVGAWRPEAGEIRLDGATLDQWAPEALGKHIGYLPQHLEMLSGTLRDNIARFDPNAEDDKVIEAARIAGVHDMILALPNGYATELGFGVMPLSGGQIQRLGLARAIYGMPRYVVLDEPNSNLDAAGDEALSRAIQHLRQAGSTVVVMAHRPSAIAVANKAMVLQNGRMVEFGDKDDVLAKTTKKLTVAPKAVTS